MPTYLFLRRLRRSPAAFSGLTLVILLVLTALFAPWLAPHDPNWQDAAARLQGPGAGHWLGTDRAATQLSLPNLAHLPGAGSGGAGDRHYPARRAAGRYPLRLLWRVAGRMLMRFTDVVMSMPRQILAFAFVAMLGRGWSTARR